jgi:hypothetical protein
MKLTKFIILLAACFTLTCSIRLKDEAFAAGKKEVLGFMFGDYWDPRSSIFKETPGKLQMVTTFRNGENFDHYTRSLTRLNLARDMSVADPLEVVYKMKHDEIENEIKPLRNIKWEIIKKSFNSLTYSMSAWDNPPFSDRTVLCRILVGQYNIFIISYTAIDIPISAEEREEWLSSLADAIIIER